MDKKYLALVCFLLIGFVAFAGCSFSQNVSRLNQNSETQNAQNADQFADEDTQKPYDLLDDTPGDWLVGGDCYEEWPYEERPEINDTTFHAPTQSTFPESNSQNAADEPEILSKPSSTRPKTSTNSEEASNLSYEQQAVIQDAIDQVQNYLVANNLPYRDVPLSIFEIRPFQNDGITGQTSRDKIIIYGFNPGTQLTATIVHELIHYQIPNFSRNAPQFWDETLTVLATAEIAGNDSGYRDLTQQCRDIINATARANGGDYESAHTRVLSYFFSSDSSGLQNYIDASLQQPIFSKMTMDWNTNNSILAAE